MEIEKEQLVDWIKEKKMELIIAEISIITIIMVIVGVRNHFDLVDFKQLLLKVSKRKTNNTYPVSTLDTSDFVPTAIVSESRSVIACRTPHNVVGHFRSLPEGWEASQKKLTTAIERGYELLPGQTWVEAYRTGGVAV